MVSFLRNNLVMIRNADLVNVYVLFPGRSYGDWLGAPRCQWQTHNVSGIVKWPNPYYSYWAYSPWLLIMILIHIGSRTALITSIASSSLSLEAKSSLACLLLSIPSCLKSGSNWPCCRNSMAFTTMSLTPSMATMTSYGLMSILRGSTMNSWTFRQGEWQKTIKCETFFTFLALKREKIFFATVT